MATSQAEKTRIKIPKKFKASFFNCFLFGTGWMPTTAQQYRSKDASTMANFLMGIAANNEPIPGVSRLLENGLYETCTIELIDDGDSKWLIGKDELIPVDLWNLRIEVTNLEETTAMLQITFFHMFQDQGNKWQTKDIVQANGLMTANKGFVFVDPAGQSSREGDPGLMSEDGDSRGGVIG